MQGIALERRHAPLAGHAVRPADAEDDDLGPGRHGHIFLGLAVGLEHHLQRRITEAFRDMDHAVRTVGLGRDVGGDVVGLDFDMVAHASAGRQDSHVGQTFRKHAGHFSHRRPAADSDRIYAAEKVVQEQRTPAAQFFLGGLIVIAVTGDDIDIFQAQLLADLALHVVQIIQAQETLQEIRHEPFAFRFHGNAQRREAHDAAAPQDIDVRPDDAFRQARKTCQCPPADGLGVGDMPQQQIAFFDCPHDIGSYFLKDTQCILFHLTLSLHDAIEQRSIITGPAGICRSYRQECPYRPKSAWSGRRRPGCRRAGDSLYVLH